METPAKGFYYHYKHSEDKGFADYAYEVIGTALHTEEGTYTVLYRPLYDNTYLDVDYSARPLEMFMETVTKDGVEMSRFKKIEDEELVAKLSRIRTERYG